MTTAYTTFLGLALPVTGELSGTWGDTVNDYITQYLDASVAGTQTISGSQTAVTLSKTTNSALAQAGSGATGSAQYNIINCTGNPAGTLTVTISYPTLTNAQFSKSYLVINSTSTSQSVVVQATTSSGTSTGTTLVSGEKALIAWNGSDFIKVATSTVDGVSTIAFGTTGLTPSTATSGAVTVAGTLVAANGGTGQSTYTTGDLLYATGSTALSKLGIGTNGQILTSTGTAPQWSTLSGVAVTTFSAGTTGFTPSSATSGAVTLAGTLATTNGGTGLTSFTANGVVYASSTSALTTGSALTFDGTTLTASASAASTGIFKATSTTAQVANLQAQNDAGTSLFMGVFGSAAGTSGTLGASSPFVSTNGTQLVFNVNNNSGNFVWGIGSTPAEQMRLTSTGLGIGTSSITYKVDVSAGNGQGIRFTDSVNGVQNFLGAYNSVGLLGTLSNHPVAFWANNAEKMRLDTSGNLGLGVTPSGTWKFEVKTGSQYVASIYQSGSVSHGNKTAVLGFYDGTYYNTAGYWAHSHYWNVNGGGTQAMTLDASGRLGVGTTSPSSAYRMSLTGDGSTMVGGLALTSSGNTAYIGQTGGTSADCEYWNAANGYVRIGTNNTERARITSGGDLLVGTTSTAQNTGDGTKILAGGNVSVVNNGFNDGFDYYNSSAGAFRFYVQASGQIAATNTTIAAISDQRLKENIRDLDDGLDVVMALKPRKFDWKEGKGQDIKNARGFIAQEFEQVFPDLIDTWKDPAPEGEEPYKAVRADLIPVLVKAIQEQQAIITDLRARVAQLEGASA